MLKSSAKYSMPFKNRGRLDILLTQSTLFMQNIKCFVPYILLYDFSKFIFH